MLLFQKCPFEVQGEACGAPIKTVISLGGGRPGLIQTCRAGHETMTYFPPSEPNNEVKATTDETTRKPPKPRRKKAA